MMPHTHAFWPNIRIDTPSFPSFSTQHFLFTLFESSTSSKKSGVASGHVTTANSFKRLHGYFPQRHYWLQKPIRWRRLIVKISRVQLLSVQNFRLSYEFKNSGKNRTFLSKFHRKSKKSNFRKNRTFITGSKLSILPSASDPISCHLLLHNVFRILKIPKAFNFDE